MQPRHAEGLARAEPLFAKKRWPALVRTETLLEIARFHEALAHFRERRWDAAEALLEELAAAAPEVKLYRL